MAELRLSIFWRSEPLEVSCECPAHGLEGQTRDTGGLTDWLQYPLEVVPDSERRAGFRREEQIILRGLGRDMVRIPHCSELQPCPDLFLKIQTDRNVPVARGAFGITYAGGALLGFLQRFVDS